MEIVLGDQTDGLEEISPWYNNGQNSGILEQIQQRKKKLSDRRPPTRLTSQDIGEVQKMSRAIKSK
jgi:hypothetical protein